MFCNNFLDPLIWPMIYRPTALTELMIGTGLTTLLQWNDKNLAGTFRVKRGCLAAEGDGCASCNSSFIQQHHYATNLPREVPFVLRRRTLTTTTTRSSSLMKGISSSKILTWWPPSRCFSLIHQRRKSLGIYPLLWSFNHSRISLNTFMIK